MLTGRAGGSRRSYPRKSRGKAHGRARLSRLGAVRPVKAGGGSGVTTLRSDGNRTAPYPLRRRIERHRVLPRQRLRPDAESRAKRGHRRRIGIADAGRQPQGRRLRIYRAQGATADAIPPAAAQAAPVPRTADGGGSQAAKQFVGGGGLHVFFHRRSLPAASPTRRRASVVFRRPAMPPHSGFGRGAGAASSERFVNGTFRRPVRCLFPAIPVSLHGPAPSPGPPLNSHRPGRRERTDRRPVAGPLVCRTGTPRSHGPGGKPFSAGPLPRDVRWHRHARAPVPPRRQRVPVYP